ncbi:hypothetical protein V6N11_077435 [Hibiscus sabdariffa]|uniref:RNase H type-1 domain-containing protein n=1 Tax=Hibiscus sabdariffa TaxID=183260 RepID=A0ABR2TDY8_9ROSI
MYGFTSKLLYEWLIQRVEDVVAFVVGYCQELEVLATSYHHPRRHDCDKWCAPPSQHYEIKVDVSVRFIGRNGNQSTHALAIEGLKSSTDHFWVDDAPALVKSLAARD